MHHDLGPTTSNGLVTDNSLLLVRAGVMPNTYTPPSTNLCQPVPRQLGQCAPFDMSSGSVLASQMHQPPKPCSPSPLYIGNNGLRATPLSDPALQSPGARGLGPSRHSPENTIARTPETPYSHTSVLGLMSRPTLPNSSPPASSTVGMSHAIAMDMPPSSPNFATPLAPIIASLQATTALYNLPPALLEKLIGEVVREDGFINLVGSPTKYRW